jgi:putative transcriptional regulator
MHLSKRYSFFSRFHGKKPYFIGSCAIVNPRCLLNRESCVAFDLPKQRRATHMFSENLKTLRKQKGFSQEELAVRLHVVRQTISKWEKDLSVPDADTLIRLAEILEVSVSELLGTKIENENETRDVAEQLSRINEQLATKNRRSRRIWKAVAIILAVIVLINIFIAVFFSVSYLDVTTQNAQPALSSETQIIIGE